MIKSDTQTNKNNLVLIDGSGYIFRAFHALPPMHRKDGTPINAVFGFTKMIMKLIDDLDPSYVAVIFDSARETFRNEIYKDYKSNRPNPPDELVPQFPIVRDAVSALSLISIEIPGFEADDIIATYSSVASKNNQDCLIVSSDKDLMQLVSQRVKMFDPIKQKVIGPEEVNEKFGVYPEKVVDVQSLAGDSTDNVPGVPGIGIKIAAELINEYGNLENLLKNSDNIKQTKRRENLISYSDLARISQKLVTLKDDVEVPLKIHQLKKIKFDDNKLNQFLVCQGFNSLLKNVDKNGDVKKNIVQDLVNKEKKYELVTKINQLEEWIEKAKHQGFLSIDTETTSLNSNSAVLVGISMALSPGEACYLPLRHQQENNSESKKLESFFENNEKENDKIKSFEQVPFDKAIVKLNELFSDRTVLKIGHNIKYDAQVLKNRINGSINLTPVDDTMCLSYVLDSGRRERHGLDYLSRDILGFETIKYEEICGKGKNQIKFSEVAIEDACRYAAEDADLTLRLWMIFKDRIVKEKMNYVYERLERPLISVLCKMEKNGIKINSNSLLTLSREFQVEINKIEEEIFELSSEKFNISSPKQLGEILFNKLKLPSGKKSKTGIWSTSIEILEELSRNNFKIANLIIQYRQLTKLKSTYVEGLLNSMDSKTNRVHTTFSMVGASTGRLSSSDPNLQNIPIRTIEGKKIRQAFVSNNGYQLISADYSQIELRLVAHFADDRTMIKAFEDGKDIHSQTASEVFGIPINEMNDEIRRKAKAINFGIIYGISGFGLSKQLLISNSEAKEYIDEYFKKFPGIKKYMEEIKTFARNNKYVETLFGRRIHINQIDSKIFAVRNFAERQAINAPIQGTAADIIKRAMIKINSCINKGEIKAKMLLQVHDELIFEIQNELVDENSEKIKNIMENAISPKLNLKSKLLVDVGRGDNWAKAH